MHRVAKRKAIVTVQISDKTYRPARNIARDEEMNIASQ